MSTREYKSNVFSMLMEDKGRALELKCTVYNVNDGMNEDLKEQCIWLVHRLQNN